MIELKRKWSRLCRKLHLCGGGDPCSGQSFGAGAYGNGPSSLLPWWSASCLLPNGGGKPSIAGFLGMEALRWSPPAAAALPSLSSLREPECQDVTTALALGSLPLSDSASSSGGGGGDGAAARELERRLRKNVPWQRAAVAEIADAVAAGARSGNGTKGAGVWLLLKGSDHAAVRRVAAVIAETHCCSADRVVVVSADPNKFGCADDFRSDVVARASMAAAAGGNKLVLVVDDVERAPQHVVECLVAASRSGALKDKFGGQELDLSGSVVVMTTSKLTDAAVSGVISLRLYTSEQSPPSGDLKRKTPTSSPPTSDRKRARARRSAGNGHSLDLNLNLFAHDDDDNDAGDVDDDDDGVPSDITHEGGGDDSGEHGHSHHRLLLESIAMRVVTLDGDHHGAAAAVRERLSGRLDGGGRELRVDGEAAAALAAASGHFVDEVMERWVAEVFEPAAATVKNGGKAVVLGVGPSGGGAHESVGFMGSVLPSRVHVD